MFKFDTLYFTWLSLQKKKNIFLNVVTLLHNYNINAVFMIFYKSINNIFKNST